MFYKINYHVITANMKEAFQYLDRLDNGTFGVFNFNQLLALKSKYPIIFQALYSLQTQIRAHSLGEYWWNTHHLEIHEEKQDEIIQELNRQRQLVIDNNLAENHMNKRLLQKRMGLIKYYLMPWVHAQELKRIQRIAAIEKELEEKVG